MTLCIVCRSTEGSIVCDHDRRELAKMLAALPGRHDRLSLMLVPGQSLPGPRVSMSRTGSPSPLRVGPLSLMADGADQVSGMLHPLIRRWQSRRTALVRRVAVVDGVATVVEEETELAEWHREEVVEHDGVTTGRRCRCGIVHGPGQTPMRVPDDDQIGTLPPREWLDTQVRFWRKTFGHHVPNRTIRRPQAAPVEPDRISALTAEQARMLMTTATGRAAYAYLYVTTHAFLQRRHRHINARMGLGPELPRPDRPEDPLQAEIEARFGPPPRAIAMEWDVKYLLNHLDAACERGDDFSIDTFAAELQALTAEIVRALGDVQDRQWRGRCPALLIDAESGTKSVCGAGLWQEPGWAQIPCPRCHSAWDTHGPAGRTLAREIHKRWPVDRRRRYNADDMAAVRLPKCPSCAKPVIIDWREVTGTGESRRWWHPRFSRCESGCAAAGRIL